MKRWRLNAVIGRLVLAMLPGVAVAEDPSEKFTVCELAQPARRSPGSPRYDDICISPRRFSYPATQGRDVLEDIKAFHATRLEWMYVQEGDEAILRELREMGLKLGLALSHPRDTTRAVRGAHGFTARPDLYTQARILDLEGQTLDGRTSVHDPGTAELAKEWLRFFAQFHPVSIQRDEPHWHYEDWDFNPHATRQLKRYLLQEVPPETLAELDLGNLEAFDLALYVRQHEGGDSVPPAFREIWEEFRQKAVLGYYAEMREWTREIVGPDVEWSCNFSSFLRFTPLQLWSDYAITELQPSGGQFGIGNPWSVYKKVTIARDLGKAIVFTLGSHDVRENKVMIGLTYAMGTHMLCPYGVYMKNKPRLYQDPALYADVYDFVHRWGKTYLAGYEEALAMGNGIEPAHGVGDNPLLRLEDPADSVYAFVRAKPGQADAPVVIHLVNWREVENKDLALTLDPDRFFPGVGLKLTLLRPGHEPEILSDGWQARVTLSVPDPWAMLIVEPASAGKPGVWAAEVETEDFRFFDRRQAVLRSRTPGAAIHYTTDGSRPTTQSPRYRRPLEFTDPTTLRTRVFAGDQASEVSTFVFTKIPPNHVAVESPLAAGLTYDLRVAIKLDSEPDLDDPMKWAGATYEFTTVEEGRTDRIALPADCPRSRFAVVLQGFVDVPRDGVYTFYANVDDECALFVDDEKVIDQTGRKVPPDLGMTELHGRRLLSQGLHKLRVDYVQMYDDYGLEVRWQGPGLPKQPIAPDCLNSVP